MYKSSLRITGTEISEPIQSLQVRAICTLTTDQKHGIQMKNPLGCRRWFFLLAYAECLPLSMQIWVKADFPLMLEVSNLSVRRRTVFPED
jgi:hypothetical protein